MESKNESLCKSCVHKNVKGIVVTKETNASHSNNLCKQKGINLNNVLPHNCNDYVKRKENLCMTCLNNTEHPFTGEKVCKEHGHSIESGISECEQQIKVNKF